MVIILLYFIYLKTNEVKNMLTARIKNNIFSYRSDADVVAFVEIMYSEESKVKLSHLVGNVAHI